ncbi:hypothetical protein [Aliikangiella coralliicola]|uniref:Nitric oxide-responding transcriptional regulator Dnr (Crp/Fnr family) n=1 Tax=Aliikangiella coralliicola TaxID=2592383 RepID=A0A545UJB6_9GAMM|nr:hypothetical protein [Aliikangiella coralliicola]TQV89558.1 hypothetical protein FLL46_01350 [Aliikangiella coralliicola]
MKLKNLFLVFLIPLFLFGQWTLAKNSDIEQLAAAEDIELKSQQIAKLYFYIHNDVLVKSSKLALNATLNELIESINKLEVDNNSNLESGLKEFMLNTHEELSKVALSPHSVTNANLVLDYSETYLEVAEFFVKKHLEQGTGDNFWFTQLKRMSLDIERANKYYIAMYAGHSDKNTLNQVSSNISEFEKKLEKIGSVKYEGQARYSLNELIKHWKISKSIYSGSQTNNMPIFVLASTKHLENALDELADYHRAKME